MVICCIVNNDESLSILNEKQALNIQEENFSGILKFGIFVDIRGTFDSVSHDAILGALRGVGVEGSILNLISSLLHQREVVAILNSSNAAESFTTTV